MTIANSMISTATTIDRDQLQVFIRSAASHLSAVRSTVLIVAQKGDPADLPIARQTLERLRLDAAVNGLLDIVSLIECAESVLAETSSSMSLPLIGAYQALDHLAHIEAAIWELSSSFADSQSEISDLVDSSFNEWNSGTTRSGVAVEIPETHFEIDEETMEIFRVEADDLLTKIFAALGILARSPEDRNALWDLRRHAHTFKGAAGIIGLKEAMQIAHRMEDVLDQIVERDPETSPQVIGFLQASTDCLRSIVTGSKDVSPPALDQRYESVVAWLTTEKANDNKLTASTAGLTPSSGPSEAVKSPSTPVVRVSLERLDDIIKLTRSVLENQNKVSLELARLRSLSGDLPDQLTPLISLLAAQRDLTDDIQAKLLHIRMVKFGTLETRLSRAVQATCGDENKKAAIKIENGEVEIDTQIIDALIEPLLHLLKNAVVHGIEFPETRRLIGKPVTGTITIRLEADDEALILSVSDDGSGISIARLKQTAIASGRLSEDIASAMDDHEAIDLIFDRGLTTAEKIDLNAGRGVGMSIVKDSVEIRGGTVLVETEPQKGSTFTILMPIAVVQPSQQCCSQAPNARAKVLSPLIMIVDDSASVRHLSRNRVSAAGFDTVTACDGAEALQMLLSGKYQPDLILSDVEMPGLDGWTLLESIKSHKDLQHIPVVIVTSLNSDEHRQKAISLGASKYLVKPFQEHDFANLLKYVLSPDLAF